MKKNKETTEEATTTEVTPKLTLALQFAHEIIEHLHEAEGIVLEEPLCAKHAADLPKCEDPLDHLNDHLRVIRDSVWRFKEEHERRSLAE